jgi:hypothetical protein
LLTLETLNLGSLNLETWQIIAIALIFCWSGFVRAGLGFGGALLSMPFLLLVDNRPLVYLPIIAVQLLFFAGLTLAQEHFSKSNTQNLKTAIDWHYLKKVTPIMIVPKLIGVFGLITLPTYIMTSVIFLIVFAYAVSYLMGKEFKSSSPIVDTVFLMLGAYISGTSLIGAPLIVAVFAKYVAKNQFRLTMFVLWYVLVLIKVSAFIITGVDLQLAQNFWLLPIAAVGHIAGMYFHQNIMQKDTKVFYRWLGAALLLTSFVGLIKEFSGVFS